MELFNNTLDTYGEVVGIVTLNINGVIININEQYLLMTDFKKDDLLGETFSQTSEFDIDKLFGNRHEYNQKSYKTTLFNKKGVAFSVEIFCLLQEINDEKIITLFIKNVTNFKGSNSSSKLYIMEQIFNYSNEAVIVTDNLGYIHTVNKSFTTITGYSEKEAIGKTPALLNSGKQDKFFYQRFWKSLIKNGNWQGEIWNKRKDGEIYPEWLTISSVRDNNNQITNYICQFSDITQRKKSEEEKHFQAYHDPLTDLPNRNLLFDKLSVLCEINEERPVHFAVLFCDLDRFKFINDSFGHEVGDELLKCVAQRLDKKLRENDIIARTGGDEFIIVVESEKSIQNLDKICLQILFKFETPFQTKFGDFKITISIGVSQFPQDSADIRELISFADVAMYNVKEQGGNHYSFFDIKQKTLIKQRLELESEIDNAINNKHFEVWYQPQINTKTNDVYGVECLLRWNHPTQGLISPDLFIPIAEANGSIKKLGNFVLKTACKQLRLWRINNVFTGVMAINVSLRQFDRNDLFSEVRDILIEEMIPGSAIEIEVTESLFSEDNSPQSATLTALRELGVKVAIDDFGTGYSSLQRLKNLPIDNVKIDKCFVDNIEHSEQDEAIVEALLLLSKSFKVSLIAEGVETIEQANKLKMLGCYNHQGFLYSKPLTADKFERWIGDSISQLSSKVASL